MEDLAEQSKNKSENEPKMIEMKKNDWTTSFTTNCFLSLSSEQRRFTIKLGLQVPIAAKKEKKLLMTDASTKRPENCELGNRPNTCSEG